MIPTPTSQDNTDELRELWQKHYHSCKGCAGCFDIQEKDMFLADISALLAQARTEAAREAKIEELDKWFGQVLKEQREGSPVISYCILLESISNRIATLQSPQKGTAE